MKTLDIATLVTQPSEKHQDSLERRALKMTEATGIPLMHSRLKLVAQEYPILMICDGKNFDDINGALKDKDDKNLVIPLESLKTEGGYWLPDDNAPIVRAVLMIGANISGDPEKIRLANYIQQGSGGLHNGLGGAVVEIGGRQRQAPATLADRWRQEAPFVPTVRVDNERQALNIVIVSFYAAKKSPEASALPKHANGKSPASTGQIYLPV